MVLHRSRTIVVMLSGIVRLLWKSETVFCTFNRYHR